MLEPGYYLRPGHYLNVCANMLQLFQAWPLFTIFVIAPGYYLRPGHNFQLLYYPLFTIYNFCASKTGQN